LKWKKLFQKTKKSKKELKWMVDEKKSKNKEVKKD